MTDHPDPTALRLEGQRLVEAATRDWALSIADPILRIPPGDRSMRENALVDLAQATRTLLQSLAALTEERDALIRDKEEAQSLLEWPFASVRELANETGRLRMNEHALTEERDRLRARLAKHEGEDTRRLLRDIAAFVEAAEAALAAKDEWREIESAPRDGTEVLVTGQRTDGRQAGTWLRAVAVWDQVDQAWWAKGAPTHITQARAMRTKPTHWRPLPAPPVTPPEGKKA